VVRTKGDANRFYYTGLSGITCCYRVIAGMGVPKLIFLVVGDIILR